MNYSGKNFLESFIFIDNFVEYEAELILKYNNV